MKYIKYIHLVFAILFMVFATVQFNDPDGSLWIAAYSSAALASMISFAGKMPKKVLLGLIGVTVFALVMMLPNTYASMINFNPNLPHDPSITHTSNVQTESFKEIGGVGMILLSLVIQYLTLPKVEL